MLKFISICDALYRVSHIYKIFNSGQQHAKKLNKKNARTKKLDETAEL